jgi:hypothetical protein
LHDLIRENLEECEDREVIDLEPGFLENGHHLFDVIISHFSLFEHVGTHDIGVFERSDFVQKLLRELEIEPFFEFGR